MDRSDEESHSSKDQGSVEDVIISALLWTEFTKALKLHYFVATAILTLNLSPESE